jgi:hypothetical protein
VTVTADDVRALMQREGIGLLEARKFLVRQAHLEELEAATTIEDLKPILKAIILQSR